MWELAAGMETLGVLRGPVRGAAVSPVKLVRAGLAPSFCIRLCRAIRGRIAERPVQCNVALLSGREAGAGRRELAYANFSAVPLANTLSLSGCKSDHRLPMFQRVASPGCRPQQAFAEMQ